MLGLKKGDEVVVVSGKEKGKRGKILFVDRKKSRVKIERVNIIKKHVKPSQKNPQGGIVQREGTVHISNVRIWDSKTQAPTRIGVKVSDNGKRVRYAKKSGAVID